jgi:hypothetical protein
VPSHIAEGTRSQPLRRTARQRDLVPTDRTDGVGVAVSALAGSVPWAQAGVKSVQVSGGLGVCCRYGGERGEAVRGGLAAWVTRPGEQRLL